MHMQKCCAMYSLHRKKLIDVVFSTCTEDFLLESQNCAMI